MISSFKSFRSINCSVLRSGLPRRSQALRSSLLKRSSSKRGLPVAQAFNQTTVCLLSALDYLAFAPGREDEAVLVGYSSLELVKTLAQIQGSKVVISAFSLRSGPVLLAAT